MELKHRNPEILPGHPYDNCAAGREAVGKTLSSIVEKPELGCTIALCGRWGTGKTTFLRMWEQDLKDNGFPTVFLNAWKTEWEDDPLISIVACIEKACKKGNKDTAIQEIKTIAKGFVRKPLPMINAIIQSILKNKLGVDADSISEEFIKLTDDVFDNAVAEFEEKEQAMNSLKMALEKLAWNSNQETSQKPLVFIIDELDRCKPDYSVRLLEVLKHLFEVRNIVFLCAIDKKHMEDAIRGYYGSERLDATEYLRRFFDLEIELPLPNYDAFCQHLYSYYELGEFFESDERKSAFRRNDGEEFVSFLSSLAVKSNLTLRQLERICAFTKLSLEGKNTRTYYYPDLSIFMTYMRFFDRPFYTDLKHHKLKSQEILDRFTTDYAPILDRDFDLSDQHNIHRKVLFMIGKLLVSYNNEFRRQAETLFDQNAKVVYLKSGFYTSDELLESLKYASMGHDNYQLSWLFRLLDILEIDY